ncbi:PREDICTED: uncharacterized protein LOC101302525 [Fragaria vesca subsp. vesca]|uniref:uncharacterized protein LOC101302525 n=1 Tax=Fragaria vesca subsp. vesca TaxID=101020 RepID=UPI0002C33E26|nr:PREDICTED: uncharacterized protein LOC101302525 [Fragaria vesca subsp. vesca]
MMKDYVILNGELNKRLSSNILARCVCEKEAKKRMSEVHEATCGLEQVVSLYRRLLRKGYYWPKMKEQASGVQAACSKCSVLPSEEEVLAVTLADDWRAPYLEFLLDKILPADANLKYKVKKTAARYVVDGGILYRKGFNGKPLRCLGSTESQQVLEEIHVGECGEHQGKKSLYRQLLSLGYYWPTMRKDAYMRVKTCHTCQAHANLIRKPSTILQDMGTPWPFHTWGLDFVGKINPASDVSDMLKGYGVKHQKSTPYYPQENGQAEATNKTLLGILSKMVFEYEKGWSTHLPDVLWAYCTSPRTTMGFSPYSLVYGSEAISLVELTVPTARVMTVNDLE